MRITSKAALVNYIKSMLGEPLIRVEVTDFQYDQIIDDTIQKFTEYAYGTLEGTVLVQINGMNTYNMPDTMTNLKQLSKGSTSNITNFSANYGAGYVPDLWSKQFFSGSLTGDIIPSIIAISSTKAILDKFFADDIAHNFNHLSKKLQVLENYKGPALIYYEYEYIADESYDLVYNHEWIKAYAIAKTKLLWGSNVGKYDQTLVGGARINYENIQQQAQQEIELLNEELRNKWTDPAPIDIA